MIKHILNDDTYLEIVKIKLKPIANMKKETSNRTSMDHDSSKVKLNRGYFQHLFNYS